MRETLESAIRRLARMSMCSEGYDDLEGAIIHGLNMAPFADAAVIIDSTVWYVGDDDQLASAVIIPGGTEIVVPDPDVIRGRESLP